MLLLYIIVAVGSYVYSIKEEKENTYDTQIKNAESQFTSNEQQIDNQPFINLDDELPF